LAQLPETNEGLSRQHIGLLSEGLMTAAEIRGGRLTNTSSESLAHHRESLSEVENMLVKLADGRIA
jgi:hypothetical protein